MAIWVYSRLIIGAHRRSNASKTDEVLTASYQQVKELYFQNPQFGFYFLRLTTERLFDNISRLEKELVRKNEMLAQLGQNPA